MIYHLKFHRSAEEPQRGSESSCNTNLFVSNAPDGLGSLIYIPSVSWKVKYRKGTNNAEFSEINRLCNIASMPRKRLNVKYKNSYKLLPVDSFNDLDELKEDIRSLLEDIPPSEMRLFRNDGVTEIKSITEIKPELGSNENVLEEAYFTFEAHGKPPECAVIVLRKSIRQEPSASKFDRAQVDLKGKNDKALFGPMNDPRKSVDQFVGFIEKMIKEFDSDVHFAPYTALIASSMTGKTRFCLEALNSIWGVYICWRKKGQSGSPAMSYIAHSFSFTIHWKIPERRLWFIKMILACLQKRSDEQKKGMSKKEWKAAQLLTTTENNDLRCIGYEFWSDVLCRMDKLDVELFSENLVWQDANCATFLNSLGLEGSFVVFSDEASNLIDSNVITESSFHDLRNAVKLLPNLNGGTTRSKIGIGLVLVDTQSKVANFMPSEYPTNSYRIAFSKLGNGLMAPYWTIDTWDSAFTKEHETITVQWFDEYINYILGFVNEMPPLQILHSAYFKRGRPAWTAYENQKISVDDLIELGVRKWLVGENPHKFDFERMNPAVSVALLSSRFCLEVSPTSKLASDLVGSYMAQCLLISDDRERIHITYGLDGYMAEAACTLMNMKSLGFFLKPLLSLLASSLVTPGPKGEFYTRCLVGLGMDQAVKSVKHGKFCLSRLLVAPLEASIRVALLSLNDTPNRSSGSQFQATPNSWMYNELPFYIKPVSVRHYLYSLFPREKIDKCMVGQLEDSNDLGIFLGGTLFFNRCTQLEKSPDVSVLRELFYSGQFGQCVEREKNIDQIIPVLLPDRRWSFIVVQSRLYKGPDPKYRKVSTTFEEYMYGVDITSTPCMLLYFSLGFIKPVLLNLKFQRRKHAAPGCTREVVLNPKEKQQKKLKHICIGALGISSKLFPFLSADDVDAFHQAIRVQTELEKKRNEEGRESEYINNILSMPKFAISDVSQ